MWLPSVKLWDSDYCCAHCSPPTIHLNGLICKLEDFYMVNFKRYYFHQKLNSPLNECHEQFPYELYILSSNDQASKHCNCIILEVIHSWKMGLWGHTWPSCFRRKFSLGLTLFNVPPPRVVLCFRFNIHVWSYVGCHRKWQNSRSHWPKKGIFLLIHWISPNQMWFLIVLCLPFNSY